MTDNSPPPAVRLPEDLERLIADYGRVSGGYFAGATLNALRLRIAQLISEARSAGHETGYRDGSSFQAALISEARAEGREEGKRDEAQRIAREATDSIGSLSLEVK